jgi:uncharacterized membrane protein SpoIIM required for sporulation
MVFEKLYTSEFLLKNKIFIFVIALAYSVFGIAGSLLLFHTYNPSTTSLALISLILLVVLKDILKITSLKLHKQKKSMRWEIFKEYLRHLSIFAYLFAGIMLCFAFFSMILPVQGSSYIFAAQYSLLGTASADQLYSNGDFFSIFLNNLVVLVVCLVTSFLFGIGTIYLFVVIWNASVIGVIFGLVAKQTAVAATHSPILIFFFILIAALPHIVVEIASYLLAGITGENLSNYLFFNDTKKKHYFSIIQASILTVLVSIVLLIIGSLIEISFAPYIISMFL